MKKFALAAVLIGSGARAQIIPLDKQAHALACYGISLSIADIAGARDIRYPELVGAGVAVGIGTLKELVDHDFDGGDLAADITGAVTAAIFRYSVRF